MKDKDRAAKAHSRKMYETKLRRAASLKERYAEEKETAARLREEADNHSDNARATEIHEEREWASCLLQKALEHAGAHDTWAEELLRQSYALVEEAERLREDARRLQGEAQVARLESIRLAREAHAAYDREEEGRLARLGALRKHLKTVRHRAEKRAREAEARAERISRQFEELRKEILLEEERRAREESSNGDSARGEAGKGLQQGEAPGQGGDGGGGDAVVEEQP